MALSFRELAKRKVTKAAVLELQGLEPELFRIIFELAACVIHENQGTFA